MCAFKGDKHPKANPGVPFCFLNVFKPKGITSFDVIYKLRKHLGIKKIGHSGTLDPLASGVMQVAVGSATRLLEYLGSDKKYAAKIRFGYFSTTGDKEGEITEAAAPRFTKEELLSAINLMIGEIEQTPPVFSAVKVCGKRLYEIARKGGGEDVEIPSRKVKIYEARLIDFNHGGLGETPSGTGENQTTRDEKPFVEAEIEIFCSKGTYIRSFALDLAKKLNTGAYLTDLTRTLAGNFEIKDSVKIEDVNLDCDGILPHLALQNEIYELNYEEYKLVLNGVSFFKRPENTVKDGVLSLVFKNSLVSIGVLEDNKIICKKVFRS